MQSFRAADIPYLYNLANQRRLHHRTSVIQHRRWTISSFRCRRQ